MKKRLILSVLIVCFSLLGAVLFGGNDTYAATEKCLSANGHMYVSSPRVGLDIYDLGGETGVGWACDRWSTNSAVIFFANSVSISNGVYTIYPDTELSNGDYTTVQLRGMVHYHGSGTSTQYASHIGFCLTEGTCGGTGRTGEASVNLSAEGGTAGGIVRAGYSGILQRAGASNPHNRGTDYWALPYYYNNIQINNAVLRDKIKNWRTSGLTISQSLKNGGQDGWVKFYIHRCYSTRSDGLVTGRSTCEEGAVYLYVTGLVTDNPTTFDGAVTAKVGTCTGTCWIDSASSSVTFYHQMTRNNNGPNSNISSDYWLYYDKTASQVNVNTASSAKYSYTFAKNSGWKDIRSHVVSVSLDPGESVQKCQTLGFYETRNENGTVKSGSAFKTKSSCVTVNRYQDYTFSGSVSGSVRGVTRAADGKYYIDSDSATVDFESNVCRTDTSGEASATTNWQAWHDKASGSVSSATNPTASTTGSAALAKKNQTGQCRKVHIDTRPITGIAQGDYTTRDTLGYYNTVYHSGGMHNWTKTDGAVTIHRYYWYNLTGKVDVSVTGAKKEASTGYWWTENNFATLRFTHSIKSDTAGKKTKFKTSKNPTISNDFGNQASYTETSVLTNADTWYAQLYSPSSEAKTANVDKGDNGTQFCQTLSYYSKVREDLNWSNSSTYKDEATTSGCVTVKRRKTTFTGSSKVYIQDNGASVEYTNDRYSATGSTYPIIVPITFAHTVVRSSNDAHGSENNKHSHIKTSINNDSILVVHDGDDDGSVINTDTNDLAPGGSDTRSNTFNLKVYPGQTVKLCQQMNYVSEVQGTEPTATANASEVCVTVTAASATCLGQEYGIHNAKNYLRASIYKNNAETANQSSGVKYQGSTTITAWAKPGDQINFKYEGCAGGELARQYANATNKTVYNAAGKSTKTSPASGESATVYGYLFGRSMSDSPYTASNKNFSNASDILGTGPFTDGSYTITTYSPSGDQDDDRLYSCDFYGTNGLNNFYRIPAYINNLTNSTFRNSCKSDDYGRVNDLGSVITQEVTWSDTQYVNGRPVTDHNGATATMKSEVKIPYNYTTTVNNSGVGGYIIPGTNHTESIKLNVDRRRNTPVNGANEYATVTKPTKYRLLEIVIDSDNTDTSTYFNNLVNNQEYFVDGNGTKALNSTLNVCIRYGCRVVATSGDNKYQYDPAKNVAGGQTVVSYTRYIPYDTEPGVKFCYISAVWPSDSHSPVTDSETGKLVPITDPTAAQNEAYALSNNGSYWHVSGATCYTAAKRPSVNILGGDTYAQGYISARVQKYPADNNNTNPRIYGSWTEYAAISGLSLKGLASGASLWGGSNIIESAGDVAVSCTFSTYTFANADCKDDKLGEFGIDPTTSSNPETIANQIMTRYTRTDSTGEMNPTNSNPIVVKDGGICKYNNRDNTYEPYDKEAGATFACIGDTGAKYTHVKNENGPVAYIPNDVNYCMVKGDTNSNRTSIIHADGTLIIGTNVVYGNTQRQYVGQDTTDAGMCYEDQYNSISEIPQSIMIAKKIIIKGNVKHVDSWLIADEIITCDPSGSWRSDVPISDINAHNCNTQLTLNGPVMTKSLKLYRTYGSGFTYDSRGRRVSLKSSPAEIFMMGPEVYLWSFNQAQRYSQATTTYARELAPRY
ncbi:hypothetical protein IJM16_02360 [Candidatus Saccharibacteria bacterium]|nr:hypothetical protein [Candidatus Saccharibacteria bacterium]